ncbi:MAG: flagellar biosynthesis anti-sigma factor FlgM [Gammaproteobacteria bacterium]|nr:flagellar biosynthesis anti-sigma factor FlgM [Gammaproteobacteria bacterium]NND59475.1 flagellar biosynthesis anti-sigma factor FlgM [Gammaproteobacteria bacterium]
MSPKINGVPGAPPRVDNTRPTSDAGTAGRPQDAAGSGDEVSLTESAQLLVKLEKILQDVPEIDRERVETIKQAIADGTYSVDAERVAAEVLRMEMGLKPE